MDALIHTVYESNFCQVLDFKCRCTDCHTSDPEYNELFCISFVRKGNFLFNVFRNCLDAHTGCVLVNKAFHERTVTHAHTIPDECTVFEFKNEFYKEIVEQYGNLKFFTDPDTHCALVRTDPELEFLHFEVLRSVFQKQSRLKIDGLIIEIIKRVLPGITDYGPNPHLTGRLKKNHLVTIETAKQYMIEYFCRDISLGEIASHCHVSCFHFSRLFKVFTSTSPHQYLARLRLKHTEMLLRTSSLPVGDIGFLSGFNSVEHFTACFTAKFGYAPSKLRSHTILK